MDSKSQQKSDRKLMSAWSRDLENAAGYLVLRKKKVFRARDFFLTHPSSERGMGLDKGD